MECTLITFINNSSNIYRMIILYLFQVGFHMKLSQSKVFYSNLYMFTGKWYVSYNVNLQPHSTTHRDQLSRGMG